MTQIGELKKPASAALEAVGWDTTRRVPIPSAFLQFCSDLGRTPPSSVLATVESFNGISLPFPHFSDQSLMDAVQFDAERVCRNMNSFVLKNEYEQVVGESLFPFAQTDYGLFFMLSEGLGVFGGHSPYVGLYGTGLSDFFNRLFDRRRPIRLVPR